MQQKLDNDTLAHTPTWIEP